MLWRKKPSCVQKTDRVPAAIQVGAAFNGVAVRYAGAPARVLLDNVSSSRTLGKT